MKTVTVRIHGQAVAGILLAAVLATTTVIPGLRAQSAPPSANSSDSATRLSDADLDDLLGPIALYPDALVGVILPASTVPSDITLAARYLGQNGDSANVDGQPWDESVRALARYPDVLKWMDENLEWTSSLGEAFVEQPADVMNAVQRLRGEAKQTGNLVNTPQQTVVVEKETIRIVPTDPEIIYVPQYDPEIVYVQPYQPDYGPLLTFGAGFVAGAWLSYDFDWGRRDFYYGNNCGWNNRERWNDRGYRDGSVNVNTNTTNITNITNNNSTVNRWQPNANSRRFFEQRQRQNLGNTRIARAQAEARRDGGVNGNAARKNARLANGNRATAVPRPARLNTTRNGQGANRPAANAAAADRRKNPNAVPNQPARPNVGNTADRKPNGQPSHRPKAPTAAPSVAGERPGRRDEPRGSGANRDAAQPARKPASVPSAQRSNPDRPKTAAPANSERRSSERPKASQPSRPKKAPEAAAPTRKPSAQRSEPPAQRKAPERSRESRPAPVERPRSQPRPEARPQQARPQQSRPQQSQAAPKRSQPSKADSENQKKPARNKKKENN